jgi:NAD-dependent SIR2 family protein deacetylase
MIINETVTTAIESPKIGDIRKGFEIGMKDKGHNYIFHACADCHKEGWVPYRNDKLKSERCHKCACALTKKPVILNNTPPSLGEIRDGRSIGKEAGTSYIWHACIDCGEERWVECRKGELRSQRCYECRGKPRTLRCQNCSRKNAVHKKKNRTIIVSTPYIGETRYGDEIAKTGYRKYNKYIFHACLDCGATRWVILLKGNPLNLRCRECRYEHYDHDKRRPKIGTFKYNKAGYKLVVIDSNNFYFPMCCKKNKGWGWILEHRLIKAMEQGRLLHRDEIVHHEHGEKGENNAEDLELTMHGAHTLMHNKGYKDGYARGLAKFSAKIKKVDALKKQLDTQLEVTKEITADEYFGLMNHRQAIIEDIELRRKNLVASLVSNSDGFSDAGFIKRKLLHERTIYEPRLIVDSGLH